MEYCGLISITARAGIFCRNHIWMLLSTHGIAVKGCKGPYQQTKPKGLPLHHRIGWWAAGGYMPTRPWFTATCSKILMIHRECLMRMFDAYVAMLCALVLDVSKKETHIGIKLKQSARNHHHTEFGALSRSSNTNYSLKKTHKNGHWFTSMP